MHFQLPRLPYSFSALEPFISAMTMQTHYDRHHKAYIEKTNHLLEAPTAWQDELTLEEIVQTSTGALFNNASQAWNHCFFWHCLRPSGGSLPSGEMAEAIRGGFGSFDRLKQVFTAKATELFGSGYVWLVKDRSDRLTIVTSQNADSPIVDGDHPLLTLDVWEHAYYLDHRNERKKYVDNFWNIVDWNFVAENLSERGLPNMTQHMVSKALQREQVAKPVHLSP